jgi:hypothetical protein
MCPKDLCGQRDDGLDWIIENFNKKPFIHYLRILDKKR